MIWEIHANPRNIIVKNYVEKLCLLIYLAAPAESDAVEKLSKFETEISRMWHLKAKTLPVVIGTI